jgi:hypothetical protein
MLCVDGRELMVHCLVLDSLLTEFELIIGMDVIEQLGGVQIGGCTGGVRFGAVAVSEKRMLEIEDADFSASFDGAKWTVRWKWLNQEPVLHNKVACYRMGPAVKEEFDKEVQSWIDEGILSPVPEEEFVSTVVPMMAVEQVNKGKVRPVLDYKQVNNYVSCHSGGSAVCDESIRKWRLTGKNLALLDLKKAYLQIHVDKDLWKHQIVKHKGKYFHLTRLGFGLNCAPNIMSRILEKVLSLDDAVADATDNFYDDILVSEDVVHAEAVANHLETYGLKTKPAERLDSGAKVLGLQVEKSYAGDLVWKRANPVPEVGDVVTRRELFSICGQLVGHNPVAGWLRVACGFVKRNSGGIKWEDSIGDTAHAMLVELVQSVVSNDPVGGRWNVCAENSENGRLWCDASSLALGCALEIGDAIVEDAAWLRKKEDGGHINMAELDAVVKGINLAVKWKVHNLEIMTDSATVYSWLNSCIFDSHKIKTRGMSEMLVKRRLAVVKELCAEYSLNVSVSWVESAGNKADRLTRVSRRWLEMSKTKTDGVEGTCCVAMDYLAVVKGVHDAHHLGVDRTLYLARLQCPQVSREHVRQVVSSCVKCKCIDPAPVTWEKGDLSCDDNWWRIAADVTHYNNHCYLTMIDCGPSRFSIWRKVRGEDASSILTEVEQVFRERGPPAEFLMDNGATFRSGAMRKFLAKWGVEPVYRCAYRPSGNGIVERCHRTIKRMAARSNADPLDMVFWFNTTPKNGTDERTVPAHVLHGYDWRLPLTFVDRATNNVAQLDRLVKVGDQVFVKPRDVRCTSVWPSGTVTSIDTATKVGVNGIPRHIADIRLIPGKVDVLPDVEVQVDVLSDVEDQADVLSDVEDQADVLPDVEPAPAVLERPRRRRHAPDRFGNNIFD